VRAVDESTMRASAYNLRIRDREGRYCLFNTRRGTARLLDQQEYLFYWSADSGESSLNDAGDLVMQLADDGFLVENDTNELADIEAEHLQARRSRGKVSLIIAPTMACNLDCDCSYCLAGNLQGGQRPAARASFHLHSADQLSHSAARHRAAANHADALPL
jgi:uncharacterized protein